MMPDTEPYRTRHAELQEIVSAISEKLNPESLGNGGALDVCSLMCRLVGMLSVHLSAVDNVLCSAMINSSDQEVSDAARQFKTKVGDMKGMIESYFLDWSSPAKVSDDPQGFMSRTETVFAELGSRIERESTVLYPLAERI